jgi:hypothetical protein
MSSNPSGTSADRERGQRHRGPSLLLLAVVFAGLFIGSLVIVAAMTHGGHFPSPFEPNTATSAFFVENREALRFGAFLQFGASVPLVIFAATASSRLRFLGIEAAGTLITLVGGALASSMAALSALAQWALVQPDLGPETRALHLLSWATGGPGFVVPFGLLVAGVAVTGGLSRKLPRWVLWSGLFVAIAAELSSLSIAFSPAMYLLPLARFTGLVWLIVVGALLPSTRVGRANREAPEPSLAALEGASP